MSIAALSGARTLLYKEVLRFWKVGFQTVAAPVLTAMLYLVIFGHALGDKVQVGGVGSVGETGSNTNILSYDTWDDEAVQKAKGMTDAGSPEVEVARDPDDAGQDILRTAADTNLIYAFKIEGTDVPDANPASTPTIRYNRGLVVGPREPNGRNEDFDLEVFTLGLVQKQIKVDPVAAP